MNDDLSLGIHTDMLHLPAAVSDEAGAGPQLDGLTDRFNRFRLADLAGRHLGMDTHVQKREKSADSSIAWLVGISRTLNCLSRVKRNRATTHAHPRALNSDPIRNLISRWVRLSARDFNWFTMWP